MPKPRIEVVSGRHVGIPVASMAKVLPFYCEELGFRIVVDDIETGAFIDHLIGKQNLKIHVVKLVAPDGWMLELLEYLNAPQPTPPNNSNLLSTPGHAHFALTVRSVDDAYESLIERGLSFINPPKVSPSGKAKVAFCRDPEGNFIELVEVIE